MVAFDKKIVALNRDLNDKIKIMVYGDPGNWKTKLAGTSPNGLILDADDGTASAASSGSSCKKAPIRDYDDLEEAVVWLREGGYKEFDWVWFDSITLFQELGLDDIMETLHAAKPHRMVYAPDKGEFGQNMNRLSRYCRQLKALPTNVGFICHAMPATRTLSDGTVIESMMPTITGRNMSEKISGYMDIVAHMQMATAKLKEGESEPEEYPVLSVRRKDQWYGKDRYNVIGRMPRPTIPKITALIEEARKGGVPAKSSTTRTSTSKSSTGAK